MNAPSVRALAALVLGVAIGVGAVGLLLRPDAGTAEQAATEDANPNENPAPPPEVGSDAPAPAPDDAQDPEPPPPEAAAATPSPPPLPPLLVTHLEAVLTKEELDDVDNLSVLVVDEHGRELASLRPDLPVTPASTTKLVTAAAALRLLGPDYRYVTRVFATGEVSDGTLHGDLVILGSGDPALASPVFMETVYPARPHTDFDALAAAVEESGIHTVRGSVRGDPRLFEDEPVAEGWLDRYFSTLDTTHASGLTVDGGRRVFEREGTLLGEAAEDPGLQAAEVLTELLEDRGVEVAREPSRGDVGPDAAEIARVRSRPLHELLVHVVQHSDNHMADGVFRTVGALAGAGTWDESAAASRQALADVDVDWSPAVLADGSGLSRVSRLSARHLVELDRTMTEGYGEEWASLMAVAGESGTLRSRLRGTVAEGRLIGKTGALRDARGLAGHVLSLDGDARYHFAVVGSELEGPEITAVRLVMDEVALLLAGGPPPCHPDDLDEDGQCPGGAEPASLPSED